MPQWQGRSRGNPLGYRIFIFVLKTFGVRPAYGLLRFVAVWFFLTSFPVSRITYRFFRRLGYRKFTSVCMVYENFCQLGQTVIDKVVLMANIPNDFSFNFDDEPFLREIIGGGRGGILLSAHVGNWEIAGHLLKRLETTINIVMYDGEHEQIKKYMHSVTGERRANIILIKEDLSHIYEISGALSRNELLCMHADRFMEGSKTIEHDFLGSPALFPAGPFVLATTFRVPVTFVFAMKTSPLHYHFFATPPQTYSRGRSDIPVLLGDFCAAFGEKTRAFPKQWFNYFAFWK